MKIIKTILYKKAQQEILEPIQQPLIPPQGTLQDIEKPSLEQIDQFGTELIENIPSIIKTDLIEWTPPRGYNKGKIFKYYLQLIGVPLISENSLLVNLGYKFRKNGATWSKEVNDVNALTIEEELNMIEKNFNTPVSKDVMIKIKNIFMSSSEPITETSEEIQNIKKIDTNDKEKFQIAKDVVRQSLQKIVDNIDTPETQAFMDSLTNLNNKFYKYTYLNSMLIALQNGYVDSETGSLLPRSGTVSSKNAWQNKFGRKVKDEETNNGMDIFIPMGGKPKEVPPVAMAKLLSLIGKYIGMNGINSEIDGKFVGFMKANVAKNMIDFKKGGKIWKTNYDYMLNIINKNRDSIKIISDLSNYLKNKLSTNKPDTFNPPLRFKMGPVYDMDQTEIIPGQEEKDPKQEMERVESMWLGNNNTPTEQTISIRDLAIKAANKGKILKNKNITIDLGYSTGKAGGRSMGEEIQISDRIAGERELFTLIHELAHSVLHFKDEKSKFTREEAEVDAEGAAYVIMGHYGFSDNERAYNYLANWTRKNSNAKNFIMDRFEPILEAANAIIAGIEQQKMEDYGHEKLSFNWYKKIIYSFNGYQLLLKEAQLSGEESY